MGSLTQNEPVAVAGGAAAVVSVVTTGIALAVAFGAHINDVQKAAIVAFVLAVIVLGTFLSTKWARNKVVPVTTAQAKVDAAFVANPSVDPKPKV